MCSIKKVAPRNFIKFCKFPFLNKVAAFLGLLIVILNSIGHGVLHWWELIPFYQRISRITFEFVFQKVACTVREPNRHIFEILLQRRHILVAQNCRVSVKLHHWNLKIATFAVSTEQISDFQALLFDISCLSWLCRISFHLSKIDQMIMSRSSKSYYQTVTDLRVVIYWLAWPVSFNNK